MGCTLCQFFITSISSRKAYQTILCQPTSTVRYTFLQRMQRIFTVVSFVAFAGLGLLIAQVMGVDLPLIGSGGRPGLVWNVFASDVALVSGHAGNDSGAVCTDADGQATLTEAQVNATVAELVAQQLRRTGVTITILDEMDARLSGLRADVFLSLHSDSCVDLSGYKAASRDTSAIPDADARLIACIDQHYPAATGQSYHPDTITRDMIDYHAFKRIDPQTPAAILELGFLGGDRHLLENEPERVAAGVTQSILCFLNNAQQNSAQQNSEQQNNEQDDLTR